MRLTRTSYLQPSEPNMPRIIDLTEMEIDADFDQTELPFDTQIDATPVEAADDH